MKTENQKLFKALYWVLQPLLSAVFCTLFIRLVSKSWGYYSMFLIAYSIITTLSFVVISQYFKDETNKA